MEYREFRLLLDRQGLAEKSAAASLVEVLHEFPYFQTAHLLLAKALHDQRNIRSEKQLRIAAAYSGDRKALFTLIHSEVKKNVQETTVSPFILDTNEPIVTQQEEHGEAELLNPFIAVSEDMEETEIHATDITDSLPAPQPVDEIIPEDREPLIIQEEEAMPETFPETTDPHDIIRNRLAEILGTRGETSSGTEPEAVEMTRPTEPPAESAGEDISEKTEAGHPGETETTPGVPAAATTEEKEPVESSVSSNEVKLPDTIRKSELEHAMEDSILHSLESLPVISSQKPAENAIVHTEQPQKPEIPVTPKTFSEWLRQKSNQEFGKIEIVHAEGESTLPEKTTGPSLFSVETLLELPVRTKSEEHREQETLIDRFIATDPRIVPSRAEFYSPAGQAKKSVTEHDDLISETLARIYEQQGHLLKARACYERLALLFPGKSVYFAALVQKIDDQLNQSNKQDI
ncbi:MAG: tetratricopeptide repeat protein [Bacteroidia bacterium]|nr:tetratricopeptide repeat protein [Bacteroidia bacterium]